MAPPPPAATAAVQAMTDKENAQQRPLQRRISMSTQQRQPLQPRNDNRTSLAAATSTAPAATAMKDNAQQHAQTLEAKWDEARSYSGPSSAAMWHAFYDWSLTHAPAHTHSILDAAVNSLADGSHRSQYSSQHCTRLFVQWADCMAAPLDYYGDVWSEGIGRDVALLYGSWADCCELHGRWDEADGVYMKGLLAQAQPLGDLIAAYNQFKLRWTEQRRRKDEAVEAGASASAHKKRGAAEDASVTASKQAKTTAAAAPQSAPTAAGGEERDEPGYDPAVLSHEGVEQQFEEARARHWRSTHPKPPPQQLASAQQAQPAAKQAKRQALRRMDLSPPHMQPPTAASGPAPSQPAAAATPTSRSESNDLAAFFQADARADGGLGGVRQASPTMFTKAAADEVDAMWHDTTSVAPILPSTAAATTEADGRPSYSFTSRSLTSELSQVQARTPAGTVPDYRARPSPVSFNIHEDTELIALTTRAQQPPQQQPAVSFTVYQDTALLSPGSLAKLRTAEAAGQEEDDDEIALAEAVSRGGASVGSATPVSTASAAGKRAVSLIGLTPILETSRESDASSLSNLSIRSSSSVAAATPSTRLPTIPATTPLPTAPAITITDTPTSPATIDPYSAATRALIVADLHFASDPAVRVAVHGGAGGDELQGLVGGAAVEGSTVEVGELFLRVERRMADEEAGERERVCVYGVQDMDSGEYHVMHVLPAPSLWSHYISHCLTTRLTSQPAALSSFHLVTSSHLFSDLCCSLLPPSSDHITLSSLLAAYQRKGKLMGEALVHYYTSELLHTLLLLSAASIVHANLAPATIHVPSSPPPPSDYASDRPAAWSAHGPRVGQWQGAVDVLVVGREVADERLDVRGLVGVVRAMLGGGVGGRGVLAGAVVRLECCAGESEGGSVSVRHLAEVKEDVDRWLMGEGGARARLLKKLLCEQSVLLSSV